MDHAARNREVPEKEEFARPEKAIYFSKARQLTNDRTDIPAHKNLTNQLDYEAELAVIIKKDAKDVKPEEVKDYIFGYTIMNDVSAREVQTEHKQWYFGKSLDGFTPLGPCIMTADSTAFPPVLKIQSKVNGELRQDSNTGLYPWNRRSDLRTYKRNDIKGRNDHRDRNAGRSRHGIRTAEIP